MQCMNKQTGIILFEIVLLTCSYQYRMLLSYFHVFGEPYIFPDFPLMRHTVVLKLLN